MSAPPPSARARPSRPHQKSSPPRADELFDLVLNVVRAYAHDAFDVGEIPAHLIQLDFDRWVRHVAMAAPHPERPADPVERRDWVGMLQMFRRARRREREYVVQTLGDLREVIWSFVRQMHGAMSDDQRDQARVGEQLSRLRTAIDAGTSEDLRREAARAVAVIGAVAEERTKRQHAHLADLGRRVHALTGELEAARREGETDPLTRLANRKSFDDFIQRTAELSSLGGRPAALLMVDVDHFKSVNDAHGHPVGDEVLRGVANCLARTFLRKGDFIARYGGEEFAVILRDTPRESAQALGERLRAAVRNARFGSMELAISVSVGIALLTPGEPVTGWIRRADVALYRAKQQGRDRVAEDETAGEAGQGEALAVPAPSPRIARV